MSDLDQVIPKEAKQAVLAVLAKQVALWVVVLAFVGGIVLAVVVGGTAEHKSSLLATVVTTPLFIIQVTILAAVALAINYMILWVRGRKAYDKLGRWASCRRSRAASAPSTNARATRRRWDSSSSRTPS